MFRFTIRDVLWLTVVVAIGVGWWMQMKESFRLEGVIYKMTRAAWEKGYEMTDDYRLVPRDQPAKGPP